MIKRAAEPEGSASHFFLLAGLPGVGKTRLAEALAPRIDATILSRDAIRDAIVPARHADYGREQNDIATDALLAVLGDLAGRLRVRTVLIDGKPFSRASEIGRVKELVEGLGGQLTILHCVAPPGLVEERLTRDLEAGATDVRSRRDPAKAARIRRTFEPIEGPHFEIDTSGPIEAVTDAVHTLVLAAARRTELRSSTTT